MGKNDGCFVDGDNVGFSVGERVCGVHSIYIQNILKYTYIFQIQSEFKQIYCLVSPKKV